MKIFFLNVEIGWLENQIWCVHIRENSAKDTRQIPNFYFTLFFLPFSFPFPIPCLVIEKRNINFYKPFLVSLSCLRAAEHPVRGKRHTSLSAADTDHEVTSLNHFTLIHDQRSFKRQSCCVHGNSREGATPYNPL